MTGIVYRPLPNLWTVEVTKNIVIEDVKLEKGKQVSIDFPEIGFFEGLVSGNPMRFHKDMVIAAFWEEHQVNISAHWKVVQTVLVCKKKRWPFIIC